jgi:hypothetical protein
VCGHSFRRRASPPRTAIHPSLLSFLSHRVAQEPQSSTRPAEQVDLVRAENRSLAETARRPSPSGLPVFSRGAKNGVVLCCALAHAMRAYTDCRASPSASAVVPEHAGIDVSNPAPSLPNSPAMAIGHSGGLSGERKSVVAGPGQQLDTGDGDAARRASRLSGCVPRRVVCARARTSPRLSGVIPYRALAHGMRAYTHCRPPGERHAQPC